MDRVSATTLHKTQTFECLLTVSLPLYSTERLMEVEIELFYEPENEFMLVEYIFKDAFNIYF